MKIYSLLFSFILILSLSSISMIASEDQNFVTDTLTTSEGSQYFHFIKFNPNETKLNENSMINVTLGIELIEFGNSISDFHDISLTLRDFGFCNISQIINETNNFVQCDINIYLPNALGDTSINFETNAIFRENKLLDFDPQINDGFNLITTSFTLVNTDNSISTTDNNVITQIEDIEIPAFIQYIVWIVIISIILIPAMIYNLIKLLTKKRREKKIEETRKKEQLKTDQRFKENYLSFLQKIENTRPNQELKINNLATILNTSRAEILNYINLLTKEEKSYGQYFELEDVFVTSSDVNDLHDDIDNLINNFDKLQNQKI